MSGPDQALRKQAHDYVQRLRIVLANSGSTVIDKLNRETVEAVTESMCEHLGIHYYPPPDLPHRNDGRPSPWARKARKSRD